MEIKKEMSNILKERMDRHIEDDLGIQSCWNRIIELLSQDESKTIKYLQECSKEEIYWISEVFEDISERLNSVLFITCLRELDKRYPDLDMTKDIDLAEGYVC